MRHPELRAPLRMSWRVFYYLLLSSPCIRTIYPYMLAQSSGLHCLTIGLHLFHVLGRTFGSKTSGSDLDGWRNGGTGPSSRGLRVFPVHSNLHSLKFAEILARLYTAQSINVTVCALVCVYVMCACTRVDTRMFARVILCRMRLLSRRLMQLLWKTVEKHANLASSGICHAKEVEPTVTNSRHIKETAC